MEGAQIMRLAARLRWLFPRHAEVLQAASELERLAATVNTLARESDAEMARLTGMIFDLQKCQTPVRRTREPKRDRALYMRDYRRRKV